MGDRTQSLSSINSSPMSSQLTENTITTSLKSYLKDLLKSRIFLGRYLERRLVNECVGYRDIVLLSAAETELKRDLHEAHEKLCTTGTSSLWIGITDSDLLNLGISSSICIWTEIDNQPFGTFWFQIKGLKYRCNEICIALNCLRHITDAFIELEPILSGPIKKPIVKCDLALEGNSVTNSSDSLKDILKSVVAISNVKEFLKFIFALVVAIFTGGTSFVSFIGDFTLGLLREISIFVNNSTPLVLGFLDFISKIVGGFYILMAMMFKPSRPVHIPNKRDIVVPNKHGGYNYYNDNSNSLNLD
ncbi:uncharacterized protein LOC126972100 [Leptidea sinapis]|uniref:uncharacterized protein LOC126972100 n=1 Tax=Leptidea sinapis TaxID=189913 RepID=UPI0021C4B6ED|nr:uncharacterized protein LOC126972100 [Leptidea sinapis]